MAIVVVDGGESLALQYVVNKASPENLVLRLYTNNITPAESDVAGGYTEAAGNGYAAKTLTGATWTISGTAPTSASYGNQTFTFTGALGNVYGYYYTRATGGELIAAERFSTGPFNIQNNGDAITFNPTITAD